MVFKGFKDENGNVIPVQGAGTVYNEEKNSLALGKETVAIGQDQLVFGRYNEEGANKAEIVGGGNNNTEYQKGERANIALTDGDPNNPIKNNISVEYFGDEDYFIANYNFSADTRVTNPESIIRSLQTSSGSYHVWKVLDNTSLLFFLTNTNELPKAKTINVDKSWTIMEDSYGVTTWNHCYIVSSEKQIYKNIRTLDWQGNEKLAGSLTVGTGITIGETSLSEAQLIALKALLNS